MKKEIKFNRHTAEEEAEICANEKLVIPRKVSPYLEGKGKSMLVKKNSVMKYLSGKNEINVVYWSKWPSYDFIFGVPARGNKDYGIEACFFQYRNTKHKKVKMGFCLDLTELHEILKGFNKVAKLYKQNPSS